MEVTLDKRFDLDVEPARAWAVLRDVHQVARCMPGAEITEQVDATHFKGTVKVKLGPANAAFGGNIEVLAWDEASRSLQLLGKGADRSGSSASMNLSARIEAGDTPARAVLAGSATVVVTGKFAQFGGRMMTQVADLLLGQFADNFRAVAAAVPTPTSPTSSASSASADGDAAASPSLTPPATTPAAPLPARELNAWTLGWALLKRWLAGVFGRRA